MPASLSQLQAVLSCKCPSCRKGRMFLYPTFNYFKFNKMHKECPACKANFEPEPGFYYGAMYISYALNVAIVITAFVASLILFDRLPLWILLANAITPVLILFPLNFRISRSVLLHLFGGISYGQYQKREQDRQTEEEVR